MTGNARAQQHLVNAGSIWELIDLMFAAPAHSSCDCLRCPLMNNVSHMSSREVCLLPSRCKRLLIDEGGSHLIAIANATVSTETKKNKRIQLNC